MHFRKVQKFQVLQQVTRRATTGL